MINRPVRIKFRVKSYHNFFINRFVFWLFYLYHKKGYIQQIFLPKQYEIFTVLRSPHVDKKARDQFERIIYNRIIILKIVAKKKDLNWIFSRLNLCLSFFSFALQIKISSF